VLTDVFGATPSRIATQLAERDRVVVVAGVNLPLLIKALGNRRGPVDELIDTLIESGQRAIRLVDGADLGDSQATPQEARDGTR